ncbi:glutamyl-tRNA amidotransferase subunit A [Mesorhizobium sp. L-8-10]|uniref:amidase n=1 Tax=Mesorhizobium sp. L-8-10 TaxID=2744523 RepID=UPI001928DDFE|nr:amidase family protein [Mesorhizobium sp. L-8-10]BCH29113.1 glutamyl-tRNA amidotransferase subunit A [Mesorhizobium sp. L-8-10]
MTDIADLTAIDLAARIRRKSISPVEATKAVLARIEARRDLNAFIMVTADEALAEARAAEQKVMAGEELPPLHGVPYSVKDLVNTAGVRTTMGSRLFENNVPKEDGVAVARARRAGAILVGKNTTPEFGHVQSATSPLFGRTLNPIDPTVTPGASSSGAAVAVAAGMGPIALGTDGGGSIRIPAACCGVVGMKPTLGAVPHLQLPDLFGANSFVGPMARNVADAALLFEAIAGPDRRDPYGQAAATLHPPRDIALSGLRVGWIARGGARVETEVADLTAKAVEAMAAAGALVEPVDVDFKSFEPVFLTLLRVGLAARTGPSVKGREALVSKSLLDTIALGEACPAVDYANATAARTKLFQTFQSLFERFDVIVSPTLTAPPLPIDVDPTGDIEIEGHNEGTVRGAWYPFTYPQNLTGHPAISLPCGWTTKGLPVGLQLCAPWYEDRNLLRVAALVEDLLADTTGR